MFRVEWNDLALSTLANAWTNADSNLRAEITRSIRDLEIALKQNPSTTGESRIPGTRVIVYYPLTVTFQVNVRTNLVLVSNIRVHKRREA